MCKYMKSANRNKEASQEHIKFWYDQKAALTEYQPGQLVWVLEPVAPRALQDKWTGPYPIWKRRRKSHTWWTLAPQEVPTGLSM